MDIPGKGRIAAHVLIDAVSVARASESAEPADLAYQRLLAEETFAVTVDEDEAGQLTVNVDLSEVLGASLVTIDWLVEHLAANRGVDRDVVLAELRSAIDD